MSLPRYSEYMDRGVAWLGEVPRHWIVRRARAIGTFTASGIDKKFVEGEQPVKMFNYVDVYKSSDKKLGYSEELMDTTAPREKVLEHAVREGDLLLTPSSETADDIGHAAQVLSVPEGVVYSYHVLRFRPNPGVNTTFLTYAFNSSIVRSYFSSVCTGTTRMVLVRGDFKNTVLPLPSFEEQQTIAAFLDRETGKIDALIAEQQRLVELLAEKRQAVISHAVTKGLNPNAKMKDSGIEWLGEVPEHWELKRLKYLGEAITGLTYSPSDIVEDDACGILVLRSSNVQGGVITFDDNVYVSAAIPKELFTQVGDILICSRNGSRALIGKNATIDEASSGLTFGAFMTVFRSRHSAYLSCVLNSPLFEFQSGAFMTSTINQLTIGVLNNFEVPLPPESERADIAAYLAVESAKFDTLTAEANRAITLLQERRSALISAAVTGKIDVRQAA